MSLREPTADEIETARNAARVLREVMGTAWDVYITSHGGVRLAGIGSQGEVVLAAPGPTAAVCHTFQGKWIPKATAKAGTQIRWATSDERRAAWE